MRLHKLVAYLGIASAGVFVGAFLIFAVLTPDFHLVNDYISKLGAKGQPFALWWNVIGFVSVGVLFSAFGWAFSRVINDRIVGFCLVLAGVGFAVAAIPTDFTNPGAPMSKAHFVSICLGLAGWCLGLARIAYLEPRGSLVRKTANVAATLAVLPMIGAAIGLFTDPIAHRLVLAAVFGWILFLSVRFLMYTEARTS